MEQGSLICSGCGSANVNFDPRERLLVCCQCGKREYYSRATLSANAKVIFAKENAINFFRVGRFDAAWECAMDVLNIFMDSAPAIYIISYYEEFVSGKNGAMQAFFTSVLPNALEYDEIRDLMKLFLASPYKLMEFEPQVIRMVAVNLQDERDKVTICSFVDQLSPYLIGKWPSTGYFTEELAGMYRDLAEYCGIPKTCFALIKAIQTHPESPYVNNTFFLKPRCRYFYTHFVQPIEGILNAVCDVNMRQKFLAVYRQRSEAYLKDTGI